MIAVLLERPTVSRELIEQVRREKQIIEEALNALERYPFNRQALLAAGIPEAVISRLRFADDDEVLQTIVLMKWDAFAAAITMSVGPEIARTLPLEIQ